MKYCLEFKLNDKNVINKKTYTWVYKCFILKYIKYNKLWIKKNIEIILKRTWKLEWNDMNKKRWRQKFSYWKKSKKSIFSFLYLGYNTYYWCIIFLEHLFIYDI